MTDLTGRRLSRAARAKLSGRRKARISILLAFILVLVILGRIYREEIASRITFDFISFLSDTDYHTLADSILTATSANFGLEASMQFDSAATDNDSTASRHYHQKWPSYIPFVIYVKTLSTRARQSDLFCDCVESKSEDSLNCAITHDGTIMATVTVESDRRTHLPNREFSLVVRNLGAWKNEDISRLIEDGVLFSCIGTPNTYPTERVRKSLESAGVVSILALPRQRSSLIISPKKKGKKDKSDRELWDDILSRHPGTLAIRFDESGPSDLEYISQLLVEAAKKNISYIFENTVPDKIDSLAYSDGLDIIRLKSAKEIADYSESKLALFSSNLIREMSQAGRSWSSIIIVDASKCGPNQARRLYDSLRSAGAKPLNFIALSDTLDSIERIDR